MSWEDDMDMDDPILEIEEYSRMPIDEEHEHPYVMLGDVEIDAEIASTIQTFWAAGIATEFSCQGDAALGDAAYIMFASAEDLARAVAMIADHEVSIESYNVIRYRGVLRLQAPKEPVELPILPMGDMRVLWEDDEEDIVETQRDLLGCFCHVVDGEIHDPVMLENRYNPVWSSPREVREAHELELERFKYPWCT